MDPWGVVLAVLLGPGAIVAVVALIRGYQIDLRLRIQRHRSLLDWLKAERAAMRAIDEIRPGGAVDTPGDDETGSESR